MNETIPRGNEEKDSHVEDVVFLRKT